MNNITYKIISVIVNQIFYKLISWISHKDISLQPSLTERQVLRILLINNDLQPKINFQSVNIIGKSLIKLFNSDCYPRKRK